MEARKTNRLCMGHVLYLSRVKAKASTYIKSREKNLWIDVRGATMRTEDIISI